MCHDDTGMRVRHAYREYRSGGFVARVVAAYQARGLACGEGVGRRRRNQGLLPRKAEHRSRRSEQGFVGRGP